VLEVGRKKPPIEIFNHTYANMDGNTTMAAIAADLAAKKGLLVFASVGNDGINAWHFLSTPSDGDSVVAVGAVDTLGTVANFSSYGPAPDGRIKPDMASIGFRLLYNLLAEVSLPATGHHLHARIWPDLALAFGKASLNLTICRLSGH